MHGKRFCLRQLGRLTIKSRNPDAAPDAPLSHCRANHDQQTQHAEIFSARKAAAGLRCGPKSLRRLSVAAGARRREEHVARRASEARGRLFHESRKSEEVAITQPNRSSSAPPPRQSTKKHTTRTSTFGAQKHARQAFKFAAPTFAMGAVNTAASSALSSGVGRRGPTHRSRKSKHRGGAGLGGRGATTSGGALRIHDLLAHASTSTVPAVLAPRIQPGGSKSLDLAGTTELAMLMSGLGLGAEET